MRIYLIQIFVNSEKISNWIIQKDLLNLKKHKFINRIINDKN